MHLTGPRPRVLPRGYPRKLRTLGDHIRKRRHDLGLWQRTVADTLGVRSETIRLWERGLARPLPCHYGRIVQFLGYDPQPEDRSLAGRLRAIRRRLGLSQAKLATLAGLDVGSVSRWESGSRPPSRWIASRAAAILARLEDGSMDPSDPARPKPELPSLTYYDRTRWRRRPPPDLTDGGPISLGERIRHRRLQLRLSQEELGAQFGVGRDAVRRWERGDSMPHESRRGDVVEFLLGRASP
jgi:transcriptional regulator with XRE-family HTH domain